MAEIDKISQSDFSIPGIILMENAGIKLYGTLHDDIWKKNPPGKVLFAAGKGNNGGDAFVMARQHYLLGNSCTVIIPDNSFKEGLAQTHYKICSSLGIEILDWKNNREKSADLIKNADFIIEGLSGTGLNGELKNSPAEIADCINNSEAETCSVDIPSGVGDSYHEGFCAVEADYTLTVGLPKFALFTPSGRKKCGKIITVPIGFPPALIHQPEIKDRLLDEKDIKHLIPGPSPYTYKNKKGHTLVLAGSAGMTGAAKLCAESALNSLSGLVTLKVTEDVFQNFSNLSYSLITDIENYSIFDNNSLDKYSAAAVGPGWGITKTKKNWLKAFLSESSIPAVLDADAISLLAELLNEGLEIKNPNCIITPHIGEFSRLTGHPKKDILDNPFSLIRDFSVRHNIVTVLKSHVIWISDNSGIISVVDGNNPAMASAGSGDILTGITAGLLSYGITPSDAAAAAVLLHQKSGLLCYNDNGFFVSERIIKYIGKALKESLYN